MKETEKDNLGLGGQSKERMGRADWTQGWRMGDGEVQQRKRQERGAEVSSMKARWIKGKRRRIQLRKRTKVEKAGRGNYRKQKESKFLGSQGKTMNFPADPSSSHVQLLPSMDQPPKKL